MQVTYAIVFVFRKTKLERKDLLNGFLNKSVVPWGDTSIPPVSEIYETLNTPPFFLKDITWISIIRWEWCISFIPRRSSSSIFTFRVSTIGEVLFSQRRTQKYSCQKDYSRQGLIIETSPSDAFNHRHGYPDGLYTLQRLYTFPTRYTWVESSITRIRTYFRHTSNHPRDTPGARNRFWQWMGSYWYCP